MKYSEDYLWNEYGILCVDEEERIYKVPLVAVTTEDKYWEDCHGIKRVKLPKLENNCVVDLNINYKDDTLDIVSYCDDGYYEGKIQLKEYGPSQYHKMYNIPFNEVDRYNVSDDSRYYAVQYIAEKIRKQGYTGVLVEFVSYWTEEQVERYVKIED